MYHFLCFWCPFTIYSDAAIRRVLTVSSYRLQVCRRIFESRLSSGHSSVRPGSSVLIPTEKSIELRNSRKKSVDLRNFQQNFFKIRNFQQNFFKIRNLGNILWNFKNSFHYAHFKFCDIFSVFKFF